MQIVGKARGPKWEICSGLEWGRHILYTFIKEDQKGREVEGMIEVMVSEAMTRRTLKLMIHMARYYHATMYTMKEADVYCICPREWPVAIL